MHNEAENPIGDLYDQFGVQEYSQLARDAEAYPLIPVIQSALERYEVLQHGKSVLDLGCGPGLLKEITTFGHYAGVDLSETMLQAAAQRGYQELIQARLEDYLELLPDASFDVVICFSVTYFMSPELMTEVLRHIDRIAKDFWLVTFDAVPDELQALYKEDTGIALFNHVGFKMDGADRFMVEGWKSAVGGEKIMVEVVSRRKNNPSRNAS